MLLLALLSTNANAASFWKTGTITRTLSDHYYGGCMIYLSVAIENGCPSKWVSLDCDDKYFKGGDRKFASALLAKTTKSTVSVYIDNTKKHNSYCVARRIDIR